jgi:hypothetical protein
MFSVHFAPFEWPAVFDVKAHLTAWWLKLGYFVLTLMFAGLAIVYTWAAVR